MGVTAITRGVTTITKVVTGVVTTIRALQQIGTQNNQNKNRDRKSIRWLLDNHAFVDTSALLTYCCLGLFTFPQSSTREWDAVRSTPRLCDCARV